MEHTSTPSAEDLFLAAIERAPGERAMFLDSACGGDAALRAEVEMLVACHDGAGEFLEHSPAALSKVVDDFDLTRLPERIGKFHIERVLGAGGMGCVYLAESTEPRRHVALKVVRPGLGTREMSRRFRQEVQVVAVLQHPGIAQLYEAGVESTPGGPLPFFAMEYVEGPTITGYAREHGLDWRDRMGLVARVAEGVHHAHQKGVIHRDLKPANILVSSSGQPKILDFGVARLMASDEAGGGMQTAAGQVVGTLSYMSPEQLSGDPRRIDARADIYALGVVLYELLAGAPPYDVASVSLAEAVKKIGETEPRRLSEIDRRLRGDAEIIVEKAMAKDASARYQSALELAADIRRCLADEPILARRASTWYHLHKFAKRNKVLVSLAAAAAVSLVTGIVVSMWQASEADAARNRAVKEANKASAETLRAEESADIARTVNQFMLNLFASARPNAAKKTDMTVREVLDRSSVESLRKEFGRRPQLQAQLNLTIGKTYHSLSLLKEAEPHLVEAMSLMREHFQPTALELLDAQQALGHLYKLQDRLGPAEASLRDAIGIAELTYGWKSDTTIGLRNDLGSVLLRGGNAAAAETIYREAGNDAFETLGPQDNLTLASWNNLAAALVREGQGEQAIAIRYAVLADCLEKWGEDNHATITAMSNLARDLSDEGWIAEAAPLHEWSAALRLRLQGPDHRSTLNTMCNVATALARTGRVEEASAILEDTVQRAERTIGDSNSDWARYIEEYGRVLAAQGRIDEAETCLYEAYAMLETVLGPQSGPTRRAAKSLVEFYEKRGMVEAAEMWNKKARP